MSDRPPSTSQLQQSLQAGDLLDPGVSLHWEQCENCPMEIDSTDSGFFNGKLYIGGGLFSPGLLVYTPSEDSWEIIDTPAERYALATYRSQLVLVDRGSQAGKVWLLEAGLHWVPHLTIPALPHSSSVLAAVGFDDCLLALVEDGFSPGTRTAVKLFNGKTWFTSAALELALLPISPMTQFVVVGDDLYLYQWNAIHRTSLQSLVASAVAPGAPPAQWEKLPDPPLFGSNITWFGGHLLAVGGSPEESAVHAYNHAARKWEHVYDVPGEGFYGSCCAALPTGELLVVGGVLTPTRVLKATIRVSHTAESLSLTTTSGLLHTLEQDLLEEDWAFLESRKERLAAKAREHFQRLIAKEREHFQRLVAKEREHFQRLVAKEREHFQRLVAKEREHFQRLVAKEREHFQRLVAKEREHLQRLTAKESEHFHQQPAPGIPTDPPLKSGGLEVGMKALTLSKHPTSSDHITEMFDTFEKTLLQSQAATGSKASLMLDTLSAAREEYWLSLKHTENIEDENAMLKYKLLQFKLPPEELLSDIKPLVKPEIPVKQEIKREEMMSVAEPTSATSTAELRGVEAIAETFVRVTRAGRSFHWAGYGLKLTFPPNCLPPGVEECIIAIQASISGQYQLPEGTALVSAVYWFKCKPQITFEKRFTLEIQNCAKPENVPKLKFYRASSSQQELPYSFQPLENGVFTKHSSYGSEELDQFCGVTVGQDGTEERNCCASLFYFGDNERKKNIDLVISLDLDAHITAVLKAYESIKNAFIALRKIVEFEREKIYLEMKTHIRKNGWSLIALALPMVKKSQVDNFKKTPPCCSLELKYTGSENPPDFEIQIPLKGTTVPEDFITIQSKPTCRATVCEMLQKRTEQPQSTSSLRGKHKLSEESHSPATDSSEPVKRTKSTTTGPSVYQQAGPSGYPPQQLLAPMATSQAMAVPTLIDYLNCLPEDVATITPSPNDVAHIAKAINDWKGLSSFMGFTDADQTASNNDDKDEESKRRAVLNKWLRKYGSAATFAELVSVAHQADDLILVKKITEVANFPHSH